MIIPEAIKEIIPTFASIINNTIQAMEKLFYILCLLAAILFTSCCGGGKTDGKAWKILPAATPQLEAHYDRSKPVRVVDVEQGLQQPRELKLSQIASEIEYYYAGRGNFMVTQIFELPDSNAFITFNNPRIYYRKADTPSKRYGFKALAYKWNNELNGSPLFYDKKTSRMYVALSGKTQETRVNGGEGIPSIGELLPLDTMLKLNGYIYPESLPVNYPLNMEHDKLLGFSSTGYTTYRCGKKTGEPDGITTFNLQGDMLCRFQLKEGQMASRTITENIPFFQTSYWNTEQDKMTFLMPYCDTVYQLRDAQTIAPLYAIHFGDKRVDLQEIANGIPVGKIWLKSFHENPKGIFLGLFSKGSPLLKDWEGQIAELKPTLTHQTVYLKEEDKTYQIADNQGFINNLDGGLNFWPDGQFDDCLYMTRTIREIRKTLKQDGSPEQQKLIDLLNNPIASGDDYLIIVVRQTKKQQ